MIGMNHCFHIMQILVLIELNSPGYVPNQHWKRTLMMRTGIYLKHEVDLAMVYIIIIPQIHSSSKLVFMNHLITLETAVQMTTWARVAMKPGKSRQLDYLGQLRTRSCFLPCIPRSYEFSLHLRWLRCAACT